jgi:hypothetical protein
MRVIILPLLRLCHSQAEDVDFGEFLYAIMEAANPSVSIDLLIKSLLALGATREDIATAISGN